MLQSGSVKALGTMSGTSLDGVDAALIETDGVTISGFGQTEFRPYTPEEQATLRAYLGRWPGDALMMAEAVIETAHIEVMKRFDTPDIAAFHGQTLAHEPGGRGTLQCGDGQAIADALGYPVVWDFRTKDVAAGGQGAPMAPFYHFALAKWLGADAPVAFLNLGGVGNITWIDPSFDDPADAGALLAFDTGPANAPMNDEMMNRLELPYDSGGALAATGTPDPRVIRDFMSHPYFEKAPPKSLDRDAFAGLVIGASSLPDADAMATLAGAVVESVTHAVQSCPIAPTKLLVAGGGRHNKTVMDNLAAGLDCAVTTVDEVGLNGDMIEAQAFAYLAVRAAKGLPLSSPQTTGVPAPTTGGIVAQPFKTTP